MPLDWICILSLSKPVVEVNVKPLSALRLAAAGGADPVARFARSSTQCKRRRLGSWEQKLGRSRLRCQIGRPAHMTRGADPIAEGVRIQFADPPSISAVSPPIGCATKKSQIRNVAG